MTTPGQQKKVGIVPYDTRLTPLPPPQAGIFDAPTRPVCINVEWIPHIDGLLERLVWADAWTGDETTVNTAIAQVRKLMLALALGNSCVNMSPQLRVRQNTEQPCTLESSGDDGNSWTAFADILACISPEFLEQSIIDAINNNADLRELVKQLSDGLPDVPGDLGKVNTSVFDPVSGCDKDTIYGYCKALWIYIDAKTVDFLQQMAEFTNLANQIDLLLSLIPGFDATPPSSALEWMSAFGDYNYEAYQSQKTVELEQKIICDLLCIAVNKGCTIQFGDVYQYFIDKLGGLNIPTATATFLEWVQFMASGDYPNDRIVYLWSAFQLALAFLGQEFLEQNSLERYALQAQAGDPDNEWDLLCEACPEGIWVQVFDFTQDAYSQYFSRVTWGDGYIAGQGWRSQRQGGERETNYLRCTFPTPANVTYFSMDVDTVASVWVHGPLDGYITLGYQGGEVYREIVDGQTISSRYVLYDGEALEDKAWLQTSNNPYLNNNWYITRVEMRGIGTNPFS